MGAVEEQRRAEQTKKMQYIHADEAQLDSDNVVTTFKRNEKKVGRNDPCPCGSGQKFKNCGLKNTPEHQKLMANKI